VQKKFSDVFKGKLTVIGMIHLAGKELSLDRALDELAVYEQEGVDAAIIENYHGTKEQVEEVLSAAERMCRNIVLGVNILPNEYYISLPMAEHYGAKFVQLDHVAGRYTAGKIDHELYMDFKAKAPVIVLGGVWPKYYTPVSGSDLEKDLREGMQRAEAVVVTGEATGKEIPIGKIRKFREIIGDHPLVVGAGLTPENAYEQLMIADGAIVGSCFKPNGATYGKVSAKLVKKFMSVVEKVRKEK